MNILEKYTKNYILSISKYSDNSNESVFDINDLLYQILTQNKKLSQLDICEILNHLMKEIKGDLLLGTTIKTIQNFSKNENDGIALLNYIIDNDYNSQENIVANILIGLYDTNSDLAYKLSLQLLTKEKYRNESLFALTQFQYQSKEIINYTYDLLICDIKDENSLRLSIVFIFNAIKNRFVATKNIHIFFNKLQDLIVSQPQTQNFIANQLCNLDKYDAEKTQLIFAMNLDEVPINGLNLMLSYFDDIQCIFSIIRKAIIDKKMDFNPDGFSYLSMLNRKSPQIFSEELIKLLIDREGIVRFMANRVINYLQAYGAKFEFSVDLLTYSQQEQYNILCSLTMMYKIQVEKILYLILPFRKSQYELVRTALFCKLENYIENYSITTISILEKELNLDSVDDKQILYNMKLYDIEKQQKFLEKIRIKELLSINSQFRLYSVFNSKHNKNMKEQMSIGNQEYEKNSWWNSISKITIARGKSWKIESKETNNQNFSPLGQMSTSFQFPREMFTNPDRYEYDSEMEINQTWNENE